MCVCEYSEHGLWRLKVRTETLRMLEGSWSVLPGDEGCEYSEVDKDGRKHAQRGNEERKGGGCEYGEQG